MDGPTPDHPSSDGPGPSPGRPWATRLGRTAVVVLMLGTATFWIWAFSPLADQDHPDRLDDRQFPATAETRCATALIALGQVPPASEAVDPPARARQLDDSTAILAHMVADLRRLEVAGDEDRRIVSLWLDDWEIYLGDRERYADVLRAGEDTAFVVTAKDGDQITEPIDVFADVNEMLSCATPLDV